MGGFKHTSVATTITARAQYTPVAVLQDGGPVFIAAAGTDTLTATYSPVIPALVNGMELRFRAAAANATTTPSFSPNGLTAKTIVKGANTALVAGDIAGQHHECVVRYNSTTDKWHLLNPILAGDSALNLLVTDTTGGAVGDFIPFVDISGSNAGKKVAVQNLLNNALTSLTADTAPDVADSLLTYDASATAAKITTASNFYKTINGLTEDTAPDAVADFVVTYDTSATGPKKVKPQNLVAPVSSSKTADYTVTDADRSSSIRYSGLAADRTLTLPAASGRAGFLLYFSNEDTGFFGVTVDANASELIDGFTTRKGFAGTRVTLLCDGTGWRTVSGKWQYISQSLTLSTGGSTGDLSHGLGVVPTNIFIQLTCITAEAGYAIGNITQNVTPGDGSAAGSTGIYFTKDATNLNGRVGASGYFIGNKGSGAGFLITYANWGARVYAEA